MFKKLLLTLALSFFALLCFAMPASAQSARTGTDVTIGKEEFVDSLLSVTSTKLNIEGVVNGNLYCTSQDVIITGVVNGNVYCAAQSIKVLGRIDGDLTAVSSNIEVSGIINGSIVATASSLKTTSTAKIRQDILASASSMTIDGIIARDVNVSAGNAKLGATIGRNLTGSFGKLTLTDDAFIKGNLDYKSSNDVVRENNTKIEGKINKTNVASGSVAGGILTVVLGFLGFMLSLLIVSILTVIVFPNYYEKTYKEIETKAGSTIGWGFFNLLVVPFAITLIFITIIGIPLAGLIAVAWVLSLMLSGPVFAYYVGKRISKKSSPLKTMFVGSIVVLALYAVPVINILVGFVVGVVGSGAVLNVFKSAKLKSKR